MSSLQVIDNGVVMVSMFLPEFVQGVSFSLFNDQLTVTYFNTLSLEFSDNLWWSIFFIDSEMSFRLMEPDIGWEYVKVFQQCLLNVFERYVLLFFNAQNEDNSDLIKWLRFNFAVGVIDWLVFLLGFDFLLGFELWEVIKTFSFDHGLICV